MRSRPGQFDSLAPVMLLGVLLGASACPGGSREAIGWTGWSDATGPGSCAEIAGCSFQCPDSSFETCVDGCLSRGNPDARQVFLAVLDCDQAAYDGSCWSVCEGAYFDLCDACLTSACSAEWVACLALGSPQAGDPAPDQGAVSGSDGSVDVSVDGGVDVGGPVGQGSCMGILDCADQCPELGYEACEQGCMVQGTASAQQLFQTLVACWDVAYDGPCLNVCQGPDDDACWTCLDSACSAQLSACTADI